MGSIFLSRDTRQVDGQRQILFQSPSKGFEEAEGGGEGEEGEGRKTWGNLCVLEAFVSQMLRFLSFV